MHKIEKKSLTDEELALLAAAGDDESMACLISKITPVAKAKASDFAKARIPDEDLVQEGMLGFLDAVKSYDPSRNVPFRSFAETCINNRIVSAVRLNYNNKNAALSSALSFEDDDSDMRDANSDPALIISEKDESEYLNNLLNSGLSELERKVVHLRLKNLSYSQISKILGINEKSIDNALQRIKKKMRAKLNK